MNDADTAWNDAVTAAALFAVDFAGTGVVLRARAGPVRDAWLASARALLGGVPYRAVPLHIADERLLGGLDLGMTLRSGRPIAMRGLLAEADGGIVQIAMAERLSPGTTARISAVLDAGEVITTRDGVSLRDPARFGAIALDEGIDDERLADALSDRLAFHVWLDAVRPSAVSEMPFAPDDIAAARARLPRVRADAAAIEALCGASLALGIGSLRPALLALRAARAAAALAGRDAVADDDVVCAARLILAPRATRVPAAEEQAQQEPPEQGTDPSADQETDGSSDRPLDDLVLTAVRAAIPAGVLADLLVAGGARMRSRSQGKSGVARQTLRHGRPVGARRGELRGGARLNVIQTLQAAAPWQAVRRRESGVAGRIKPRIDIRREDIRVTRFRQRSETVTLFVVDASGSSALHRLAEAKGAVELLLAECYVRRDQVALLAFRGRGADLLLPPTRSLVRAKRCLAALPGGGGTPLAAALETGRVIAEGIKRKGQTPVIVMLTDGRANIALDGSAGRERAAADALASARALRAAGIASVLIDTAAQPQAVAATLSAEMGAKYLPLPHANAEKLSKAALAAMA